MLEYSLYMESQCPDSCQPTGDTALLIFKTVKCEWICNKQEGGRGM